MNPMDNQPRPTLLEAAAQAFNEPVLADEAVVCRWVKKDVPAGQYTKYYAHLPCYKRLDNDREVATVAFRLPVHLIDTNKVSCCTNDEILALQRY